MNPNGVPANFFDLVVLANNVVGFFILLTVPIHMAARFVTGQKLTTGKYKWGITFGIVLISVAVMLVLFGCGLYVFVVKGDTLGFEVIRFLLLGKCMFIDAYIIFATLGAKN